MASAPTSRVLGELTFQDAARAIKDTSILCLPLGAIEQHGPHLPLNTDVIVAEGLTGRLLERWGEEFDLWQLPTLSIGLSREHDWAAGTLSLSIQGFAGYVRDLAGAIVRALPARNLAIVNGHGGNRGILENLLHEFRGDFGLNAVVLHPFDLAGADPAQADVHGGKGETSVMLALAPERVRRDQHRKGRPARSEGGAVADFRARRDLGLAQRRRAARPRRHHRRCERRDGGVRRGADRAHGRRRPARSLRGSWKTRSLCKAGPR